MKYILLLVMTAKLKLICIVLHVHKVRHDNGGKEGKLLLLLWVFL